MHSNDYATAQSLMVSVTVSSLGATQLHFLEPGVKAGSFPHPPQGGLIPPNFRTTPPPRLQGEMREKGEGEGGGKWKGEEKGRDPQGLVDTPHVPNPEKYPAYIPCYTFRPMQCGTITYIMRSSLSTTVFRAVTDCMSCMTHAQRTIARLQA